MRLDWMWRPGVGRSGTQRRALALLALVVVAVAGYAMVLTTAELAAIPTEQIFEAASASPRRVNLYLEPISVDPVSQAMQVRVDASPGPGLRGARPDAPDRDLTLTLSSGDAVEVLTFRANERMGPASFRPDLQEGRIIDYPLDRYRVALRVQAFEGPAPVPVRITAWEGVLGYAIRSTRNDGENEGDVTLRFAVRRTPAQVFFAIAAYAAMAVMTCASLAVSFSTFLGRKKAEATLIGALAALVFALPVLRNALPSAPPLGVLADLAVFFWAELAAVISLALLVLSWARQDAPR